VKLLSRPDLVCQQAVELVTEYLEGSLSRRERRRFERHLAGCDGCEAYLEQVRVTIRLTGRVSSDDLSTEARQRLVELYRDWTTDSSK
jgi:anti-sigma factor RsiW